MMMMVDRRHGPSLLAPSSCNVDEATHARASESPNNATTEQRTVPKAHYQKYNLPTSPSCRHKLKMSSTSSASTTNDAPVATVEPKKVSLVLRPRFVKWAHATWLIHTKQHAVMRKSLLNGYHRCVILHRGAYFL